MDMGLMLRTATLRGLSGEGKSSFAEGVGESGVGKSGYFRPMSVRRASWGRRGSGREMVSMLPILKMGPLRRMLVVPSSEGIRGS
jgi:hypothetical protein